MRIKMVPRTSGRVREILADESELGFGRVFTDNMFSVRYLAGKGWHSPKIGAHAPLKMSPAALCLHYGQLIFEGLKAYRGDDGSVYLFRPRDNVRRLNASAERLCMPQLDEEFCLQAIETLVRCEKDWIPRSPGSSLYLRPTMAATQPLLGVQVSEEFLFFIIASPVGAYYASGFAPTKIYVEEDFVRAAPGGIGYCKAAANYAASLFASRKAMAKGYTQVLWLDAVTRSFVEEVGTSNIFFLIGGQLITPPLSGTILPGVTRATVIELARSLGVEVVERRLAMEEIVAAHQRGDLTEVFASGTAAIVSPVGLIHYRGVDYKIHDGGIGELTRRLYEEILHIQYGKKEDAFGWRVRVL